MKWFGSALSSLVQPRNLPSPDMTRQGLAEQNYIYCLAALLVAARKAEAHEEQIVVGCWVLTPDLSRHKLNFTSRSRTLQFSGPSTTSGAGLQICQEQASNQALAVRIIGNF